MDLFSRENIFVLALAIWLVLLIAGRYQLNRIKKNTVEIVLREAKKGFPGKPLVHLTSFYHEIYPIWVEMLRKNALFIPHKSELFPIPAWPESIRHRIHFSPEWLGAFLEKNGYEVLATPEQRQAIKAILQTGIKKVPAGRSKGGMNAGEKKGD